MVFGNYHWVERFAAATKKLQINVRTKSRSVPLKNVINKRSIKITRMSSTIVDESVRIYIKV